MVPSQIALFQEQEKRDVDITYQSSYTSNLLFIDIFLEELNSSNLPYIRMILTIGERALVSLLFCGKCCIRKCVESEENLSRKPRALDSLSRVEISR